CNGSERGGPTYRSGPTRCLLGPCALLLQSRRELGRCQIAETRMRAHYVKMTSPLFDDHLRLGCAAEPFKAQALVAELAVEALCHTILPRFARLDKCRADTLRPDPCQQRT